MSRSLPTWRVGEPLGVDDLALLARGPSQPALLDATTKATSTSRQHLLARLEREGSVYGVTTGFGDSCEVTVTGELVAELPRNLFRFHGAGVGPVFSREETRAIVLSRLASLAGGYSAVRPEVLRMLAALVEHDLLPEIPEIGSVGASGDLTPLSYIARLVAGEGDVVTPGGRVAALVALRGAGLTPLELEPKESLALMNGTSAMTGIAALCLPRSLRLVRWVSALTAATSNAVRGQSGHFDPRIFRAKPHPGQALVARWVRDDLEFDATRAEQEKSRRIQDRYSIRCAPHVLGVLVDFLPLFSQLIETELNGANDNPLVDFQTGDILHGGNFYGGHVCAAMDTLKTQIANVIDLLDRQLVLLCHPGTNGGLPANLVGASAAERPAHHGFKALQITLTALAAEAARLCLPASLLSRSTENHNQDKVSMGTIAARDARTLLDLAETAAAISTLAVGQALELRGLSEVHAGGRALHRFARSESAFVDRDRPLDVEIARLVEGVRSGGLPLDVPRLADLPPLLSSALG